MVCTLKIRKSCFLLNLKAKGRKSGRSCPSAVPQKALDPSLDTRSAVLEKWARGPVPLFNFSFSKKLLREVMLIPQPVLSAPLLDFSLVATSPFPASDFLSELRVDLKATLVPVLQRGWQANCSLGSSRHTLLYMCSHTSNLFLLLLLQAHLCDYTVKAFFYYFRHYFSHVKEVPNNNLFFPLFSGYFIAITSCIQTLLNQKNSFSTWFNDILHWVRNCDMRSTPSCTA